MSQNLKLPNTQALIEALVELNYFDPDYKEQNIVNIKHIFNTSFSLWKECVSSEELLSAITFAFVYSLDYTKAHGFMIEVGELLADPSKLKGLAFLGIYGISDFDILDTPHKRGLVSTSVGLSLEGIDFLSALSKDQIDPNKSVFVKALEHLAKVPFTE